MYQLVAFNAPHGALDRIECSVKPTVCKMNHHGIDAPRPTAMQNGGSGEIAGAGAFDKLVKGTALVPGHKVEGDERLVAQLRRSTSIRCSSCRERRTRVSHLDRCIAGSATRFAAIARASFWKRCSANGKVRLVFEDGRVEEVRRKLDS